VICYNILNLKIETEEIKMVKVFMGKPGSGKTKHIVDMVNHAVNDEAGHVVCIEKGQKLTFDVSHKARLIDICEYPVSGFEALYGFICGIYASNYDTTHIFIDSLYKVAQCSDVEKTGVFLDKLEEFSVKNGVKFTLSISADIETATEQISKYF